MWVWGFWWSSEHWADARVGHFPRNTYESCENCLGSAYLKNSKQKVIAERGKLSSHFYHFWNFF